MTVNDKNVVNGKQRNLPDKKSVSKKSQGLDVDIVDKIRDEIVETVVQRLEFHSRPVPSPEDVAAYNKVTPELGTELARTLIKQNNHRIKTEQEQCNSFIKINEEQSKSSIKISETGQILNFITSIFSLVFGIFGVSTDNQPIGWAGIIMAIIMNIIAPIIKYFTEKDNKKKEVDKEDTKIEQNN